MDDQSSAHESGELPLRARIATGIIGTLFASGVLWKHGFKNWDWVQWLALSGVVALPTSMREPFGKNVRWYFRIPIFSWIVIFAAWLSHEWGWVPAGCFAVVALLPANRERQWRHPLSLITNAAAGVGLIWFVQKYVIWIPAGCVLTTLFLLKRSTDPRKTFVENMKRARLVATFVIGIIAAVWASMHPSVWSVAAPIIVFVLLFGGLYLNTSHEEPIALSDPQS
jgi:hypothetical protein